MKTYETDSPKFSETLDIVETTDPVHADLVNGINKELFENTLCLKQEVTKLGEKSSVSVSGEPPDDTNGLWIDTSAGGIPKYYNAEKEEWTAVKAVWG